MSEACVTALGDGELKLFGVLDYRTGPGLRKQGADLIKASHAPAVVLDCSANSFSSPSPNAVTHASLI